MTITEIMIFCLVLGDAVESAFVVDIEENKTISHLKEVIKEKKKNAFGNVDAWDALTPASGSASRIGWTAGAGLAVMVAPRWIMKFEYLHVDLGSANLFDPV